MKQIVDKLNDIAKAIDENVELPTSDLIIDSLDAITTAYGGTPNDSKLIVDKLEAIASVAHGGSTPTGTIEITSNGTGIDVAQYRYADVNVSGVQKNYVIPQGTTFTSVDDGGYFDYTFPSSLGLFYADTLKIKYDGVEYTCNARVGKGVEWGHEYGETDNIPFVITGGYDAGVMAIVCVDDTTATSHTLEAYYEGIPKLFAFIQNVDDYQGGSNISIRGYVSNVLTDVTIAYYDQTTLMYPQLTNTKTILLSEIGAIVSYDLQEGYYIFGGTVNEESGKQNNITFTNNAVFVGMLESHVI